MANKTFAHEKVRELVNELQSNANLDCYERKTYYEVIDAWLEQNQPAPVGLSDGQIRELNTHFICEKPNVNSPKECYAVISNYLKTQTFAQPTGKFPTELLESYNKVVEELEQLKSQQPTPSWDDAPRWANWLAQNNNCVWEWFEIKPITYTAEWGTNSYSERRYAVVNPNWQQTLQERPKPTPTVEVGQVWDYVGKDYRVKIGL